MRFVEVQVPATGTVYCADGAFVAPGLRRADGPRPVPSCSSEEEEMEIVSFHHFDAGALQADQELIRPAHRGSVGEHRAVLYAEKRAHPKWFDGLYCGRMPNRSWKHRWRVSDESEDSYSRNSALRRGRSGRQWNQ